MLELFKESGCYSIGLGVESGSNTTLKTIQKGISVEQVDDVVKMSSDVGLHTVAYFIVSLPGETIEEMYKTFNLIKKFRGYKNVETGANICIIYPGTGIERIAKENGALPQGFSWSLPYHSSRSAFLGLNRTLPLFEDIVKLEDVVSLRFKELQSDTKTNWISKGIKGLRRVKTFREFKEYVQQGIYTIKARNKSS